MQSFSWDNLVPFLVLALVCLFLSALFSLVKIAFLALSETTDCEENEKLVQKLMLKTKKL